MNFLKKIVVALILWLSLGLLVEAQSQNYCSQPPVASGDWLTDPANQPLLPSTGGPYNIQVQIYVLRMADGSLGQPLENINEGICIMRNDFASHNIFFDILDIEFIDNDDYYTLDFADVNDIYATYNQPQIDRINICIADVDQFDQGFAPGMPEIGFGSAGFGRTRIWSPHVQCHMKWDIVLDLNTHIEDSTLVHATS